MLGEVNAALSLWDRFKKWRLARKGPSAESISARFVRLFETHGVHRNQIPRFIGHELTLKDVQDDDALLGKLDEALLLATCERFAVRREWLDGAEQQVHPRNNFYKYPERFGAFLDKLASENNGAQLDGRVLAPSDNDGDVALIIIQEVIGYVGEKPIYRFHLCDDWPLNYWKSRAYLTASVASAWKRNCFIHGVQMPAKEIQSLIDGTALMGWKGEGLWALGPKSWDPEDMALRPEAFLKNLNPETDNFGIRAGLELWLELDAEGLMATGIQEDVRPAFEAELAKHKAG